MQRVSEFCQGHNEHGYKCNSQLRNDENTTNTKFAVKQGSDKKEQTQLWRWLQNIYNLQHPQVVAVGAAEATTRSVYF